jgi:hypothetical protein
LAKIAESNDYNIDPQKKVIASILCRYFVIGTVPTTPWAYYQRSSNGDIVKDLEGRPVLEGMDPMHLAYSIFFTHKYDQSDQTGRIFAHWKIVYFGQLLENYRST